MKKHIIVPKFISASEVDQLIAHAQQTASEHRTHRGDDVYCTQAWINDDHPGYQYLTAKIHEAVKQHNEAHFQEPDLAPRFEQYQYTDYNQPGDAYDWRADSGPSPDYIARRRLTVAITLTDASEHEGGGFQLSDQVGHSDVADPASYYESVLSLSDDEQALLGKKGSLIIFPSNRMHRTLPVLSGTCKVLISWVSCQETASAQVAANEPIVEHDKVLPESAESLPVQPGKLDERFNQIYRDNHWKSGESRSGPGSELKATEKLRKELAVLLERYQVKSMLDIPCGDFNWMKEVNRDAIDYTGADIVADLIANNRAIYPNTKFAVMDLTHTALPKVDLVFVRDCLGHLSDANALKAIENIQRSGSKYLLTTCFTKWNFNTDIEDGGWRCINLLIAPFKLKPQYLINEDCREGYPHYNDKCMILFDLQDLYSQ